uniref:Secreted protein n=1 Tax=Ascaris lumbricoides TaxID=6252 RepID=A0A0M3HRM0_ASCLU
MSSDPIWYVSRLGAHFCKFPANVATSPVYVKSRSQKERLMRCALRRRPCMVMAIINTILAVFSASSCSLLFAKNLSILDFIQKKEVENSLLKKYKIYNASAQCYVPAENRLNLSYNLDDCGENSDRHAFVALTIKAPMSAGASINCVDQHRLIPCRKVAPRNKAEEPEQLKLFPQCGGIRGHNTSDMILPRRSIYAPSIDIEKYRDKVLLPKDFLVKCPVCITNTVFAPYGKDCARGIKTYLRGWPEHAYWCDEVQKHEVQSFCSLRDKLKAHLSGTH